MVVVGGSGALCCRNCDEFQTVHWIWSLRLADNHIPFYLQRYSNNSGRCHKVGQLYHKFIRNPQLLHSDLGFRRCDSANLPALYLIVLALFHRISQHTASFPKLCEKKKTCCSSRYWPCLYEQLVHTQFAITPNCICTELGAQRAVKTRIHTPCRLWRSVPAHLGRSLTAIHVTSMRVRGFRFVVKTNRQYLSHGFNRHNRRGIEVRFLVRVTRFFSWIRLCAPPHRFILQGCW